MLLDLGFAERPGSRERTTTSARGSLPYLSPEQALGERGGPAADLFALGVVLYEAATGAPPALIDVISPCVAFNNHAGSTKSYDYVREHNEALNRIDFIEGREEITTSYEPGAVTTVQQHDGSILHLRKLDNDYDPSDRVGAMNHLQERHALGEIVTGLLYVDAKACGVIEAKKEGSTLTGVEGGASRMLSPASL